MRSVLTSSTNLGHCAPSTMNITGTEIRKASTCSEGKGGGGWVHVGAEGVEGWSEGGSRGGASKEALALAAGGRRVEGGVRLGESELVSDAPHAVLEALDVHELLVLRALEGREDVADHAEDERRLVELERVGTWQCAWQCAWRRALCAWRCACGVRAVCVRCAKGGRCVAGGVWADPPDRLTRTQTYTLARSRVARACRGGRAGWAAHRRCPS